jgi:DNA-binding MarR family transcriptional regulator
LLSLTPAGQRKLSDINAYMTKLHRQVLSQMEPDQRQAMLTNLDILKSSMEAVKGTMGNAQL